MARGSGELGTLEEVHRSAVSQHESAARTTLRSVEDERDEARVMLDGVRAEMAEMAATHRSTVSVLEEQRKAELKELKSEAKTKVSHLEDEKQFLASSVEKLKRQSTGELERATDALAHEKQLHQANRERYERRVTELKSRHAEGFKRVENDWMQKLEHLEKNISGRSEKAASTAKREGKANLEKVLLQHEEAIASLRKEFEMELATSKQQVHRASGFEESYQEVARELTTVQGQLESLTRDLADAHGELAERDKLVAKHKKKVADNKETIDSLKTVINDFSRSVDGYLQDRDDQDQTISSLKEVIADMYRSIDGEEQN